MCYAWLFIYKINYLNAKYHSYTNSPWLQILFIIYTRIINTTFMKSILTLRLFVRTKNVKYAATDRFIQKCKHLRCLITLSTWINETWWDGLTYPSMMFINVNKVKCNIFHSYQLRWQTPKDEIFFSDDCYRILKKKRIFPIFRLSGEKLLFCEDEKIWME